ncbi:hypothetical protein LWI29_007229 [Acer saccharum]|uniref:Reverse transcriptase n=1 Tax=Acer saccharum TaxID=4024 RepID=A0AA39TPC6_ACESA|nr:hypothetical protein LWI29_007229 [Acer saccharum]
MEIDLAKAYDKLQWGFIKHVLEEAGIVGRMNNLIMSCITTVSYKVVVNGELSESFSPKCGIRQGDPLSPYIFVLCMEKLSHIISQKLLDNSWKPVKISRDGPAISHLFFADDLILFGQASPQQAQIMRNCLDIFCDLSGQQVIFPKSRVYCSSNINDCNASVLANICGSPIMKNLGSYLGVPLIHGRIKKDTYREILEKTQKRLATWKSASLSFVGRCTLIKSVTAAIPVYAMQSIKLPSKISTSLDKINRDFLWGNSVDRKKVHLVKWDTVYLPKNLGGLGIKKMKVMNQALLAKVGWRLMQNNTSLWGRLLKDKYLKGGNMFDYGNLKSNNCSSTWRGILFGAKLLLDGMKWRVGNGNRINLWVDDWAPTDGKLFNHASYYILDDRMKEKSAYIGHFRYEDSDPWRWDFIWKLKLPPRVAYFLWTLLHGKLLTNCNRAARGISSDVTCMRCMVGCEDIEHIFRGCSVSLGIWENINKGVTKTDEFLAVFNPSVKLPFCLGKFIWKFVVDWMEANTDLDKDIVMKNCLVSWSPPAIDWIKVNVDGSQTPNLGNIAAGGVVRYHRKLWMVGFALNKGTGSVLKAELWGILKGLKLVWKNGFKKVIVESDSQVAMALINNNTPLCHPLFSIIEACKVLLNKDWSCKIQHVYWESNRVADSLTNLGHSLDLRLIVFEEPSPLVADRLEDDFKGFTFSRMIPSL